MSLHHRSNIVQAAIESTLSQRHIAYLDTEGRLVHVPVGVQLDAEKVVVNDMGPTSGETSQRIRYNSCNLFRVAGDRSYRSVLINMSY